MLWLRRATIETGRAKLLDLDVAVVPHAEQPDRALRNLRENLLQMMEERDGDR